MASIKDGMAIVVVVGRSGVGCRASGVGRAEPDLLLPGVHSALDEVGVLAVAADVAVGASAVAEVEAEAAALPAPVAGAEGADGAGRHVQVLEVHVGLEGFGEHLQLVLEADS